MINNRAVREVLKVFKVHLLLDWFFRIFPREGKFGAYRYPVASLEGWLVEKEIFKAGIYDGVRRCVWERLGGRDLAAASVAGF